MNKYPKIGQYRNFISELKRYFDYQGDDENGDPIYQHTTEYPKIKLKGRVKLHGTNGGVTFKKINNEIVIGFQSRENTLVLPNDNYAFARTMSELNLLPLIEGIDFDDEIVIFGEWTGCHKGVAITELGKKFFIFDVLVDGVYLENYVKELPELNIHNLNNYSHFDIEVDLNRPEMIQNKLIEMTISVEDECPVSKVFGISGIGEGIVFSSEDRLFRFKSKGEKHSSSNVKKLNSVDVEKIKSIDDFVNYACTENRLQQGLEHVEDLTIKHIGTFIKWVVSDILSEESDTLIENNLTAKDVGSTISTKARVFFLNAIK